MKAVIQRVKFASVIVENKIISCIDNGMLILLGVSQNDSNDNIIKYSDGGREWTQIKRNSITDLVRKTKNLITEFTK